MDKKILALILIALLFVLIYISESNIFGTETFINATDITDVGFASSAGNNVSLISGHDNRPWNGTEAAGAPWTVYITFTNVSEFDYVESIVKYNSTGTQPSQHEVNMSIWCVAMSEWEELEDMSLDLEYHYRSTKFINSSHYISPVLNGTVVLKLNHADAGNANHRLWIDLLRLVNEPRAEQVIVNNTVSTGTGTCTNCINSTQLQDNLTLKVNKSGDTMTGALTLPFLYLNNSNYSIYDGGQQIFYTNNNSTTTSHVFRSYNAISGGITGTQFFGFWGSGAISTTQAIHRFAIRGSNGGPGTETSTLKDQIIGQFDFQGHTGSGYTLAIARMQAVATSDHSITNNGGNLSFATAVNGTVGQPVTRLTIESTGNLTMTATQSCITMLSPDGNDWGLTITNAGAVSVSSVPCAR